MGVDPISGQDAMDRLPQRFEYDWFISGLLDCYDSHFSRCPEKVDPVSEFLYWRMNWHLEHHMFAGVPCYNLKKLHQEVADDMPEVRTLFSAWREMRETWKRQQTDPSYQFDTPLPETAGRLRADTSNELEQSIGELAPKGLK